MAPIGSLPAAPELLVAALDILGPSLDRQPVFGERLWTLSQPEPRRLFDSLDLMITYDHYRRVGQVRITLGHRRASSA
jgi:hypothetical protein